MHLLIIFMRREALAYPHVYIRSTACSSDLAVVSVVRFENKSGPVENSGGSVNDEDRMKTLFIEMNFVIANQNRSS